MQTDDPTTDTDPEAWLEEMTPEAIARDIADLVKWFDDHHAETRAELEGYILEVEKRPQ